MIHPLQHYHTPVVTIPIGADDRWPRMIRNDLITLGWEKWIDKVIRPLIDAGWTRFELHNPFGRTTVNGKPVGDMEYDQYDLCLLDHRTKHLTRKREFYKAWQGISDVSNYEVIAYVGCFATCPRLNELDATTEQDNRLYFHARNLGVFLNAGMSVAFDKVSTKEDTAKSVDPVISVMNLLTTDCETPVYQEPYPRDLPLLVNVPSFTSWNFWKGRNYHAIKRDRVTDAQCEAKRSEQIVWCHKRKWETNQQANGALRHIHWHSSGNRTIAVSPHQINEYAIKPEDFEMEIE